MQISITNFAIHNGDRMNMTNNIHDILAEYWGYSEFRPLQEDIIHSVLSGKDTLGLMPTGGGKSLTFQIPAMATEGICLVITPLIALMKDQVDDLRNHGIKANYICSGLSRRETNVALDNCIYGKYKFLYVSPERLSSELFLSKLKAMKVSLIVVDEAHCISQWGYDFRPSYLKIADIRDIFPEVSILALTATATPQVATDIQEKLRFKKGNLFKKSFNRPNLSYVVRYGDNKIQQLVHILNRVPGTAVVYVRSRKRSKEISEMLRENGISSDFYHAGLQREIKNEKQQKWKSGECRVMVSTNAFGMGIDKADVRVVAHIDLPDSPEEYYQEAGRAGRDGKRAYAVIIYSKTDKAKLKKRISDAFPEREFIRRIYDSLCYFLQIAEGEGLNTMYEFDLNTFCRTYKYPILPAYNALKLLEQAGYIVFTEEIDSLSRLMMTIQRDELYKFNQSDKNERLLQCILRSYTGLFTDYVFIQEDLIAQRSGLSRQEIYEGLIFLSKSHILHYIPRKKTPYIIFSSRRIESKYISISREIYEKRKERYVHRIESMLGYVHAEEECRVKVLLHYFGEEINECGECDICKRKNERILSTSTFLKAKKAIYQAISTDKNSLNKIIESIQIPQEEIVETLRYLCDEKQIVHKEGLYYINQ